MELPLLGWSQVIAISVSVLLPGSASRRTDLPLSSGLPWPPQPGWHVVAFLLPTCSSFKVPLKVPLSEVLLLTFQARQGPRSSARGIFALLVKLDNVIEDFKVCHPSLD